VIKWWRQWMWTRRMRYATQRELVLEHRLDVAQRDLQAAQKEAQTWKGHHATLRKDFAVLWDDHMELRENYCALQYARCQDANLDRFQVLAARS
jgi:hypothetical protein